MLSALYAIARQFVLPSSWILQKVDFYTCGVTMGWLLRLVTGGPTGKGAPDSSRVLND